MQRFTQLLLIGALALIACGAGLDQAANTQNDTIMSTVPDARETLADLYALHTRLFNNVTADISEAEASKRINENTNSVAWIAGHTLDIQYNLALLTGQATENPYAKQFAYGTTFDADGNYGTLAQMRTDFAELAPKVEAALRQLSDEQLDAPAPFQIPFAQQTIRGVLAFQMHHLAYEIGQLGLYRRFLGKDAMSYQ